MRQIIIMGTMSILWLAVSGCAKSGEEQIKMVNGTWIPANAELGGAPFPEAVLKTMKLAIDDGQYTVHVGEQLDKGTVKIDSSTNPKAMDIEGKEGPNKGKTFLAIYDLQGDTLRICYDLSGKGRPGEFKTLKDTQQFLVDYKRSTN